MADWSEVVRCRYCKKRFTYDCPMFHIELLTYEDDHWQQTDLTEDNGYCHYGEHG